MDAIAQGAADFLAKPIDALALRTTVANGGTIFLDEVGDVSAQMQAQLLRVLQEGEVRRVGGSAITNVDVRVISATNRDLFADVKAGRMREDLFYRLSVVTVRVPALRDRGEDIVALTQHLVARHAALLGRDTPHLSSAHRRANRRVRCRSIVACC